MILVLTLLVLLVLSMLAGANLINGLLVRSQARSEANAAIALHAAEAGVAAGMAWLNDSTNIDGYLYPQLSGDVPDPTIIPDAYTTATAWQGWSHAFSETFANGGGYATTIRFKRERRDLNGDGDCCDTYPDVPIDEVSEFRDGDANTCTDCPGEVVLFNAGNPDPDGNPGTADGDGSFGFASSHYSGVGGDEGFPVVEIVSVGRHGESAVREVALFVARNNKAQVEGSFTSRSFVDPGGSAHLNGSNFPSTLFPGSCGSNMPGVTVDVGVPLWCDNNSDGDCADPGECDSTTRVTTGVPPPECTETFDPTATGKRMLAKFPWEALGLTKVDFEFLFTKDTTSGQIATPGVSCNPSDPPAVNLWYANENGVKFTSSATCREYQGILVVHNERFDPDRWDPASPDYDAAYAGDPANGPAALDMEGSVEWHGIVIADRIGAITGSPKVVGGVIALASGGSGVSTTLSGNLSIQYSCNAVAAVSKRISYKKKIGWQRLR